MVKPYASKLFLLEGEQKGSLLEVLLLRASFQEINKVAFFRVLVLGEKSHLASWGKSKSSCNQYKISRGASNHMRDRLLCTYPTYDQVAQITCKLFSLGVNPGQVPSSKVLLMKADQQQWALCLKPCGWAKKNVQIYHGEEKKTHTPRRVKDAPLRWVKKYRT